jgi:hypothetical protein
MLPDRNFLYYNFGFGGFIFFLPAQLAHGPQSKYITAQIRLSQIIIIDLLI